MKILRSLLVSWMPLLLLACTKEPVVVVPPDDPASPQASPAPTEAEILAASDLPAVRDVPLSDDPTGVTIHRLSNGMTVYVSPMPEQARVAAWVVVRAGSRMDPAASTGLAHYLEHMLFKGTDELGTTDMEKEAPHVERVRELYAELRTPQGAKRRDAILAEIDEQTQAQAKYAIPNELDRLYGLLGVEGLNAWTDEEETVYLGSFPENRLEQWARVEAERFSDPVFRLFYPELEAVYEEKNLSLDEPDEQLEEALMQALFPGHPYGTQTTIGRVEHLRTPAYQDMVDYFERWYVPNNMALVLVGNVRADHIVPVLERELGGLRPKSLPELPPSELPPLTERIPIELRAEGEESVSLRWQAVAIDHPDRPALEVMTRLLDDDRIGLLETQLVLPQKVTWASAWGSAMVEAGLLGVDLGVRPGQAHQEVESLLMEVVGRLRRGEFEEDDVAAVRLQMQLAAERWRESPFGRAYRLMGAFTQHRPWEEVVRQERAQQDVTKQDVVRVANAYLGDAYVVGYRREGTMDVPKLDKPTITPVAIDSSRRSPFFEAIERMDVPPMEPRWVEEGQSYERRSLPAGDLVAVHNERNSLFSLEYRVERGYLKEPLLCHALELLEQSGAGDASAEAWRRELYALGSQVSAGCTAELSWIEIEGLDRNLEPTLQLVDQWLQSPRFDAELRQGHLRNTLAQRRDQLEEERSLAAALFAFASHAEGSAYLRRPSNKKLAKAKEKRLRALMTSVLDYRHRTFYYGPRTADEAASVVARKGKALDPGPIRRVRYRKAPRTTVYFLHEPGAKASVRVVLPEPPLARGQRAVAELYEQTMDGNSGSVVYQEIREARGLAYSAWLSHRTGRTPKDASAVIGGMSTQADKTPDSLSTFLEVLARPLPADRVTEAKASLDQGYRADHIDPRRVAGWVAYWDDLGESRDPRAEQWRAVGSTTADDVEAFAKRFRDRPVIIAIIGDRERVGLDRIRELGPVVEVKAAELFGYGAFPAVEEADDSP